MQDGVCIEQALQKEKWASIYNALLKIIHQSAQKKLLEDMGALYGTFP